MFKKLMGMFGGKAAATKEPVEVSRWALMDEAGWKNLFAGLVQQKDFEGVFRHILLSPLHWSVALLGFLKQNNFQPSDPGDQTLFANLCNLHCNPDWPLVLPQPVQVGSLSHRGKGVSMQFSPDGLNLITIDAGCDINCWHAPDERLAAKIRPDTAVKVDARTVSPDFRLVCTSASDAIRVWDLEKQELVSKFKWEWPDGSSPALVCSPVENLLACWFSDSKIRLIEPISGDIVHTMEGHEDMVVSCAFTADGALLISGGKDASVRIWDVKTGKQLHFLEKRQGGEAVTHIALSPDGKYLMVKRQDSPLQIWDPVDRRMLGEVRTGKNVDLGTLIFSPSGGSCACVWVRAQEEKETQMKVGIYDPSNGRQLRDLPPTYVDFPAPAYSQDGSYLAATGADQVVLWPVEGTGSDAFFKRDAWACAFAPNGLLLAMGERDKHIRLYSLPEGQDLADLGSWQHSRYLSFSPDSGVLAAVGDDRSVRIFRVALTQPLALMGKRELDLSKKHAGTVGGEAGKAWAYLGEALQGRVNKNLS